MNRITLTGRLTSDLKLKRATNSKNYTCGTIAVYRETNPQLTDFINFKAWEATAAAMVKWLAKGRKILIEGELQINHYENVGAKNISTEVRVLNWEFMDNKKPAEKETPPVDEADDSDDISDSEIPF